MSLFRYKARVVAVYDGDTITADVDLGFNITIREKFRLYGIDTPEIRTKDKREKEKGLTVRQYVIDKILDDYIEIESKEKGKYGRYLAVVYYCGGKNLNKELIKLGMGKEYYGGKR